MTSLAKVLSPAETDEEYRTWAQQQREMAQKSGGWDDWMEDAQRYNQDPFNGDWHYEFTSTLRWPPVTDRTYEWWQNHKGEQAKPPWWKASDPRYEMTSRQRDAHVPDAWQSTGSNALKFPAENGNYMWAPGFYERPYHIFKETFDAVGAGKPSDEMDKMEFKRASRDWEKEPMKAMATHYHMLRKRMSQEANRHDEVQRMRAEETKSLDRRLEKVTQMANDAADALKEEQVFASRMATKCKKRGLKFATCESEVKAKLRRICDTLFDNTDKLPEGVYTDVMKDLKEANDMFGTYDITISAEEHEEHMAMISDGELHETDSEPGDSDDGEPEPYNSSELSSDEDDDLVALGEEGDAPAGGAADGHHSPASESDSESCYHEPLAQITRKGACVYKQTDSYAMLCAKDVVNELIDHLELAQRCDQAGLV